ncbi:MAG: hypothetical protein IPM42_09455 [Saprospiraceae bacterium]|nr:hypothetical protein [Saprospiraceae bacterium]
MDTWIIEINQRRKEKGLKPLLPDQEIEISKAQIKAKELLTKIVTDNKFAELIKAAKQLNEVGKKIGTEINKGKDDFDKLKSESLNYFQSRNLLIPHDFDKFYLWLLENYYPDTNVFPRVDPNDFINYSLYYDEYHNDLKRKPKPKGKQISYVWQTNPDKEIPELYSLMKDTYKLIDPQTNLKQFTAVFTGQDIENINPIKWHDDIVSELIYFDLLICQFLYPDINRSNFQRMKSCFVKPDGQKFEANFKELKYNIEINLNPDKIEQLDLLIKSIHKMRI